MSASSLKYIAKTYGVPAKVGAQIQYVDSEGQKHVGKITGARSAHILVKFEGNRCSLPFHPTWNIEYLPPVESEGKQS